MKNNNQKIIRRLSNRSLRKNKMRNIFVLVAIVLTALLFTTLFSLGSGMIQITEEQTMRQVGTRAHAGLKNVTTEQYEKMTSHPLVKDCSYNILIGMAENKELIKRQTEIRYSETKDLEFGFVRLKEGKLPANENEIVIDTIVMDLLGLPHEIGVEVPLQFEFMGEAKEETFTVSGWYQGDPVGMASTVYLSRAYLNLVSQSYSEEDFLKAYNERFSGGVGLIQGNIMFKNSNNIEGNIANVIVDSGYSVEDISVGINWAYLAQMSQKLDLASTFIIIAVFFIMMLTGYLIIYNIFQISIIGDIRFYGLLKTIGATKKQIQRLVLRQAFLLSCIGIPFGLLMGYIIGSRAMPLLLGVAGGGNTLGFHLEANPFIFLFGGMFSLITVFISCRKPGKIAGSVSPVEAAKYSEVNSVKRKIKKSKRGAKISAIALSNLKRNKKKTIITILSLSLSVILMTEVVTFSKSFSMDQYLEAMLTGDFMINTVSLTHYSGKSNFKLPEDFFEAVNSQDGIERVSRIYHAKSITNHTLSESGNKRFKEYYKEGILYIEEGEYSNLSFLQNVIKNNSPITEQRYAFDETLLNKLKVLEGNLDMEKFRSGNFILVANIDMGGVYYKPGDKLELQYHTSDSSMKEVYDEKGVLIDQVWENDFNKEYEVMAVVEIPYSMSERVFYPNSLTTIVPVEEFLAEDIDAECFAAAFWVQDEEEAAVQSFLENYTTKTDPNTGFSSKVKLREELSSYKKIIDLVGGVLSFIIGIIGILNFINTMITSVITRKREFAMMQSIGLTNSQLRKMLIYEGLYYIGFTGVISFTIGSILSVFVVRAFNNIALYFDYQFTILPFVILLPIFLLFGIIVPDIAYRKAKKLSIVERLREGE